MKTINDNFDDIQNKFNNKQNERNIKYKLNNYFYNPITNSIPNKIESAKDLILNNSTTFSNLNNLFLSKKKEREEIIY